MPAFDYRYELQRGDEVVATGHLSRERPFEVGDRVEIGGRVGTVRAVEPLLGEPELHLVVQLRREGVELSRRPVGGSELEHPAMLPESTRVSAKSRNLDL